MNKRFFVIVILLSASGFLGFAQGGIDSKVEVERAYEGDIMKTAKMPLKTAVNDSILKFDLNFDYTTFYRPYKDLYELSSAMTADPYVDGKVQQRWLYADVAAAYPLSPKADVYIAPRLGRRWAAILSYNHYSYWGKVPSVLQYGDPLPGYAAVGEQIPADRMINRVGTALSYRWRTGEISVWGKYSSNFYAYNRSAGLSHKEIRNSMSHTFDLAEAALRVHSTNARPNSFYYDVFFRYNYFSDLRAIGDVSDYEPEVYQHSMDYSVSLGATIRTYHKVFLNHKYKMTNSFRRLDMIATPALWSITPTYRWEKGRWGVDAGLDLFSSWDDSQVMVFPDVYARFSAVPNALWISAKLGVDYEMYTFYDQASVNPWFDAEDYGHVMGDGEITLGLEGVVRDRFSYTFNVGYHRYENMLTYASDGIYQTINPARGKTYALVLDATLKWQSRDFYASLDAGYRYFTEKNTALMIPAFTLKAAAEYNIRQRIFFAADVLYHTSSVGMRVINADLGEYMFCDVPGFVDLGVKVTYAINHNFSIYLDGGNLLNQRVQYMLDYYEPGVTVTAGVRLAF